MLTAYEAITSRSAWYAAEPLARYYAVMYDSNGKYALADGTGQFVGIVQYGAENTTGQLAKTKMVTAVKGVFPALSAGSITAGNEVTIDSDNPGMFKAVGETDIVYGTALTGATAGNLFALATADVPTGKIFKDGNITRTLILTAPIIATTTDGATPAEYDLTDAIVAVGLPEDHVLSGVTLAVDTSGLVDASGTAISSDNILTAGNYPIVFNGTPVIKDANGTDITTNFTIQLLPGSLVVTKVGEEQEAGALLQMLFLVAPAIYTSTDGTDPADYGLADLQTKLHTIGLQENHVLSGVSLQVDATDPANITTPGTYSISFDGIPVITDSDDSGKDVTESYAIRLVPGVLIVADASV